MPLSWGGAAGNYSEGDVRFSRALVVHKGQPSQIRWLVRSAELMPYHLETLSQPMRTLRRQLWALRDAFKAVDHDFRIAETRLEQLNSLLLQVSTEYRVCVPCRVQACVRGRVGVQSGCNALCVSRPWSTFPVTGHSCCNRFPPCAPSLPHRVCVSQPPP